MKPTNDRRRFLQQMLALAATGVAASACGQAKAPAAAPPPAAHLRRQRSSPARSLADRYDSRGTP